MRVGLLADVAWPAEAESAAGLERLRSAGQQGYDTVWLQDVVSGGALSAPLLFAAAQLAGAGGAIGLGLCGQPVGSIHPLRVAEELAVLDIMTGGTLEWAMSAEGEAWEVLGIVLRAWQGDPFEHAGTDHQFPETSCHPVPLQSPHPTIWLAHAGPVPDSVPLEQHGRVLGMAASLKSQEADDMPRAVARLLVLEERDADARSSAKVVIERLLGRVLRTDEAITDYAIAGDSQACREQIERLRDTIAPTALIVAPDPEVREPERHAHWQRAFAQRVLERL